MTSSASVPREKSVSFPLAEQQAPEDHETPNGQRGQVSRPDRYQRPKRVIAAKTERVMTTITAGVTDPPKPDSKVIHPNRITETHTIARPPSSRRRRPGLLTRIQPGYVRLHPPLQRARVANE